MTLDYLIVRNDYQHLSKIKHLFEHAFPSEERPPFSWLVKLDKNQLFAVEDNHVFIGLISLVEYQDLVYLFFLAVKKCYRGHGYGSQILKDILNKYSDKRVFLLAEDPDVPSHNQKERNSRIKFYSHNGFEKTELKVTEYGVEYIALTNNQKVSKEDFLDVMKYLLEDYYLVYKNNVK